MSINKDIILRFRAKDEEAFDIIFYEYYKLIYSVAYSIVKSKETAEEIMLDTFQKAFTKIYTLQKIEVSSFKYWLIQIVKNLSRDQQRLLSKDKVIYDEKLVMNEINLNTNKDIYPYLHYYLEADEVEIINLYLMCDLKFNEIAKLMNSTISIVSKKYYSAIKKLKKKL